VDRRDKACQIRDVPLGLRRLSRGYVALYRSCVPPILLRGVLALLSAVRIARELPFVGVRLAPIREPGCEDGVQLALGYLGEPAPLFDRELLSGFVGCAWRGQRLQESRALHHACCERESAIRGVGFRAAPRVTRIEAVPQKLQQARGQRLYFVR